MQVLKYLENSFNEQPFRVKFELFLLPTILIVSYLYFYDVDEVKRIANNLNVKVFKNDNTMKTKIVDILKDIESYAFKENITLKKISNKNTQVSLSIENSLLSQIKFLNFLENYNSYSKIKTLEINENLMNITLNFQRFYSKDKIDISKELLALENSSRKKLISSFKVHAIVDKKVLINSSWLKVGNSLDSFVLIEVGVRYVILRSKDEEIRLELEYGTL